MKIQLAVLLGLLSAIALSIPALAQPLDGNFLFANSSPGFCDRRSREDRLDEVRDRLDDDLDDLLSSDERDELEEAISDGDDVEDAVDRLDISDRRRRDVLNAIRSAERELDNRVDFDDNDRPPSIYSPSNWRRPVD
jgi:hypothetical protein